MDGPVVEVHVEEVAARARLELHGRSGVRDERRKRRWVGQAVRAGECDPDAAAGVVGDEQRSVVLGRIGAAFVNARPEWTSVWNWQLSPTTAARAGTQVWRRDRLDAVVVEA